MENLDIKRFLVENASDEKEAPAVCDIAVPISNLHWWCYLFGVTLQRPNLRRIRSFLAVRCNGRGMEAVRTARPEGGTGATQLINGNYRYRAMANAAVGKNCDPSCFVC
jgi:hypothetical protein